MGMIFCLGPAQKRLVHLQTGPICLKVVAFLKGAGNDPRDTADTMYDMDITVLYTTCIYIYITYIYIYIYSNLQVKIEVLKVAEG